MTLFYTEGKKFLEMLYTRISAPVDKRARTFEPHITFLGVQRCSIISLLKNHENKLRNLQILLFGSFSFLIWKVRSRRRFQKGLDFLKNFSLGPRDSFCEDRNNFLELYFFPKNKKKSGPGSFFLFRALLSTGAIFVSFFL